MREYITVRVIGKTHIACARVSTCGTGPGTCDGEQLIATRLPFEDPGLSERVGHVDESAFRAVSVDGLVAESVRDPRLQDRAIRDQGIFKHIVELNRSTTIRLNLLHYPSIGIVDVLGDDDVSRIGYHGESVLGVIVISGDPPLQIDDGLQPTLCIVIPTCID